VGDLIYGKIDETKFTIQFSRADPSHLQVAQILNRQERRGGKAQYIVDAVMHYVSSGGEKNIQPPAPTRLDEKYIETVVKRILESQQTVDGDRISASAQANPSEAQPLPKTQVADNVVYDDSIETFSEDGIKAIVGALDMFRKR